MIGSDTRERGRDVVMVASSLNEIAGMLALADLEAGQREVDVCFSRRSLPVSFGIRDLASLVFAEASYLASCAEMYARQAGAEYERSREPFSPPTLHPDSDPAA